MSRMPPYGSILGSPSGAGQALGRRWGMVRGREGELALCVPPQIESASAPFVKL